MPHVSALPRPRTRRPLPGRLVLLGSLATVTAASCADTSGTLVIIQNQVPTVDSTSGACVISADPTILARSSGTFDVDLDRAYPYFVYPLLQNRLPSVKAGGVERSTVALRSVNVVVKAPTGVEPAWPDDCPGTFDDLVAGTLDSEQLRAISVQALKPCHAQHLRKRIMLGDLVAPVTFTLQLTVVADRAGSELRSDPFPFPVHVCVGCLQSMYPAVPTCDTAPKPNLFHGNPCNVAQDEGPVLCCVTAGGALICPAPDA